MDLPVSSSDAVSENGPSVLDSTFSQTAMAMIRRRMSIGKGDSKPGVRKRKHSLSNHLFGSSNTDLHAPSNSKVPSETSGIPPSGKPKIVKTFLFQLPLNSDKALPPSFNLKQEALELAGKEKERRSSEEGSNEFGVVGQERECLVKSKLVDDARVEYKLTARWELGGSLHLWSQCVHPRPFRDRSPDTCARQTRCTLRLRARVRPRFNLRRSNKVQDVDRTPSTSVLALCATPTNVHHPRTTWGDRPHSEHERVEPAVQGRADAPKPVRRAARLTRREDRRATGEPQVLRRVLDHPHRLVGARAGARRAAGPGDPDHRSGQG